MAFKTTCKLFIQALFLTCAFGLLGCDAIKPPTPPANGTQTLYYYTDGPIRSVRSNKNRKLHGKATVYYKNQKVKYRAVYRDGKLHGKVEKYAEDGDLIIDATFKNGEPVNKEHVYLKKMLAKG